MAVRKNPMEERGPAPPKGRPRYEGVNKRIQGPQSLIVLQPEEEYEKLWRHALVGTSSCIGLLESYSEIGMPLIPTQVLREFITRLEVLIERDT